MSDPNATWPRPADEPRSQPFQPVAYDFEPEFTPPHAFQPPVQQPPPPPPVYAPPVYPPPVYQRPAPPVQMPPQRSRRGLKITLAVIGSIVLLCGIGSCIAAIPVMRESGRTVTAPDELPGGLTKTDDAGMQTILDGLKTDLNSAFSTDTTEVGYYTTAGTGHAVLLAAASTTIFLPSIQIDDAFRGMSSSLSVTDIQGYPAGTLGGTVKCGASTASGIKLALCVWADYGTVGMGALFARDPADAAPLFLQIREAVETP